MLFYEFDSGDYSWLEAGFRHHGKTISEDEKKRIAEELSESGMTRSEAVSKY